MLTNTVISETRSSGNKESLETTIIDSHAPYNSTSPKKIIILLMARREASVTNFSDLKVTETVTFGRLRRTPNRLKSAKSWIA